MNANEISPKISAQLRRIKIVSQIAKFIVFCFFIFTIWFLLRLAFDLFRQRDSEVLWLEILWIISKVLLCVWYWKLAQLFRFYEGGLIFAAQSIRCLKVLGILCAIGWAAQSVTHIAFQHYSFPLSHPPPGVTVVKHVYQMGFFSFDFGTGFDFGLLLAGGVIVLVAWIMDEGRKIQEEQALTV